MPVRLDVILNPYPGFIKEVVHDRHMVLSLKLAGTTQENRDVEAVLNWDCTGTVEGRGFYHSISPSTFLLTNDPIEQKNLERDAIDFLARDADGIISAAFFNAIVSKNNDRIIHSDPMLDWGPFEAEEVRNLAIEVARIDIPEPRLPQIIIASESYSSKKIIKSGTGNSGLEIFTALLHTAGVRWKIPTSMHYLIPLYFDSSPSTRERLEAARTVSLFLRRHALEDSQFGILLKRRLQIE